ncbi:hypothetical protein LO763_05295 [Glycomyces sp. A-F 0318]|uniref:hypothetical protein n=1 Tax=Glycomyces amatae TaxID=2881355 RepID=UPI001E5EBD4A|nr:hypothetical protein [Glycomyces amatae]MCD0443041.1 hypothetical protein [Glycomyces amatae]
MAAAKVKAFSDGTRYVPAGDWAMFFTWLIDFVVFALGVAAGVVVLAALDLALDLGNTLIGIGLVTLPFAVPLLYGLCYTNGRALGAVVTGTRLVRLRDGGRLGAKGPWAMLVRTVLLPLLIIAIVVGGGYADGTLKRGSIDIARTRRLHAEGHLLTPR